MPRTSSRITWIAITAAVVVCAWFWFSPRRAWDDFVGALALADGPTLNRVVDFSQVRENLKTDLRNAVAQRAPTGLAAPPLGGVILDPLVDILVTPDGMAQLVNSFGTREVATEQKTVVDYRYRSPSQVDVHIRSSIDPEEAAGIFTFERSGTVWRLVRVWSDRLANSPESR